MIANTGALAEQPLTFNFLSPLNFKFMLKRAPNTNYDVYRINLPQIQLPLVLDATPFLDIPKPGDHLAFGALSVTFKVDENFNNYLELYNWIRALGRVPNETDYTPFNNPPDYGDLQKQPVYTGEGVVSEIVVSILDSAKQPNINIIYHDAFPTGISELVFDTQPKTVEYLPATCMFAYSTYTISTNV